jgi:predicted DNA-binding transcriptional regulator AlpA
MTTETDRLLTIGETAEILRAPVDTLRTWRKYGRGPQGFRIGTRVVYRQSEVWAWVDAQRQAAAQ